jgi:hypothetical protein
MNQFMCCSEKKSFFPSHHLPSANPKLSTTGSNAKIWKNVVPSFNSSEVIRPRRLDITPYTRPKVSAIIKKKIR